MDHYKNYIKLIEEVRKLQGDIVPNKRLDMIANLGLISPTFAICNLSTAEDIQKMLDEDTEEDILQDFYSKIQSDYSLENEVIYTEIYTASNLLMDTWVVLIICLVIFVSFVAAMGYFHQLNEFYCEYNSLLLALTFSVYPIFIILLGLMEKIFDHFRGKYKTLITFFKGWKWNLLATKRRISLYTFLDCTSKKDCRMFKKALQKAINKGVLQNVRLVESALISSDEIGDIEIITPEDGRVKIELPDGYHDYRR